MRAPSLDHLPTILIRSHDASVLPTAFGEHPDRQSTGRKKLVGSPSSGAIGPWGRSGTPAAESWRLGRRGAGLGGLATRGRMGVLAWLWQCRDAKSAGGWEVLIGPAVGSKVDGCSLAQSGDWKRNLNRRQEEYHPDVCRRVTSDIGNIVTRLSSRRSRLRLLLSLAVLGLFCLRFPSPDTGTVSQDTVTPSSRPPPPSSSPRQQHQQQR